jgi:hypothetical protein
MPEAQAEPESHPETDALAFSAHSRPINYTDLHACTSSQKCSKELLLHLETFSQRNQL